MRKTLSMLLLSTAFSTFLSAQEISSAHPEKKFRHKLVAGWNIGAAAPRSLPASIRKIESYSPLFSPSFGYEGCHFIKNKWSLGIALRIDFKGMKVKDSVAYFHTKIQNGDHPSESFEGSFSGTNVTIVKNSYLTIPVFAVWTPGKNWSYKLGGYMAVLVRPKFEGYVADGYIRNGGPLGEKVLVTKADFDFSKELRRFDYGLHAGIGRKLSKKWSVDAQFQWGLCRIFPASFTGVSMGMYNIYGNLGMGYEL
ncbi:MAG TPA: porin family protein [Flavipsychrobacter sp.]|nr:porin family protein [Flavipsychrobacter sp.]